jgi:hypothetical protein
MRCLLIFSNKYFIDFISDVEMAVPLEGCYGLIPPLIHAHGINADAPCFSGNTQCTHRGPRVAKMFQTRRRSPFNRRIPVP